MNSKKNPLSMGILTITLGGGGAERQISYLLKQLPFQTLYLLENRIEFKIPPTTHYFPLLPFQQKSQFMKAFTVVWGCLLFPMVARHHRTILSFMERSNAINIVSKLFFRHRALVSVRCNPIIGLHPISKQVIKWLYPYADHIICNSAFIKETLIHQFGLAGNNITVIYNMLGPQFLETPLRPLPTPTLITVGRLTTEKQHALQLRAIAILKTIIPNIQLLILGQGPLENTLKTLTKTLDLTNNVVFLGFQSNPEVYLKTAHAFVLTSAMEGSPNVLIEAMGIGLPVIATDCDSGPREILAPSSPQSHKTTHVEAAEFGFLIPQTQTTGEDAALSQLVEAIQQILDPKTWSHYSKKSKERATDFTADKILPQWHSCIYE